MHSWQVDTAVDQTLGVVISTNPYHNQPDENSEVKGKATLTVWYTESGVRKIREQYAGELRCRAAGVPVSEPQESRPESDEEETLWIN